MRLLWNGKNAINAYTQLEHYLTSLFIILLGTDARRASRTFAAIRDERERRKLLRELLMFLYGDKYAVFFGSLTDKLAGPTRKRNHIVHWIRMVGQRGGREFRPEIDVALWEHPARYAKGRTTRNDLRDFTRRIEFYGLLVFRFTTYLQFGDLDSDPSKRRLQKVFAEPVCYPPDSNHPLYPFLKFPNSKARRNPLQ
jgi:hypothetical protein